jgi:adenosylhomocysteine nucleosidase
VTVAVVVGLRAEARLAARLGLPVHIGGGTGAGACAAARRAIDNGATGLLSFGLAGGLDPALRPGALRVPIAVRCGDALFHSDPALMAWLGGATGDLLLGADAIAADAATKRRLWQTTEAAALDLESGPVAAAAAAHGLPFAVLRAICDPARRDLPPAALAALDAAGIIGLARVMRSIVRQPGQVADLLRLAGDAVGARRALAIRVAAIGGRPAPRPEAGRTV